MSRPYYISDTEVTVAQFLEFVHDTDLEFQYSARISPSTNHPIQNVSWFEAIRFCNWLSEQHDLEPCYIFTGEEKVVANDEGERIRYAEVRWNRDAMGFRLPTEHEFERASRDGTETSYSYGHQARLFDYYGTQSAYTNAASNPIRLKLPNRLGLFDMQGNVWEWTFDWYSNLDETELVDPIGPENPDPNWFGRVNRSGGVGTRSGATDVEARGMAPPNVRWENLGFRVAKDAVD